MFVNNLKIPAELVAQVDAGLWPRTTPDVQIQTIRPLVQPHVVKTFAPDESGIILYAPPFHTIQNELDERRYTAEQLAVHDIAPDKTVLIADFGLGSDTAVALDFRLGTANPAVIRLQWRLPDQSNRWVKVANSFSEFWDMLHVA